MQSPLATALKRCVVGDTSEWCTFAGVVNFDVDEGHVLSWSSSASALRESETQQLCFAAMPDSQPTSGGLGDICFTFRFSRDSSTKQPPLWGFSFFRARRSSAERRGVFQKSLVLLTPLPLFQLFRSVVTLLAEAYFEHGVDALGAALHEIHAWPPFIAATDAPLELPLLGRTLHLRCDVCEPGPVYAHRPPRLGGVAGALAAAGTPPASPRRSRDDLALQESAAAAGALCALGESCWSLWQLMLTGESIGVLTPSPHQCSEIVLALPTLIAPLAFVGDVRPYLSVHGPDWDAALAGSGPPPGSGLLSGATNPMLSRSPPPWLSLLTLAEAESHDGGGGGGGGGGLLGLFAPFRRSSSSNSLVGEGSAEHIDGAHWGAPRGLVLSWQSAVEVAVRPDERVLRQLRATAAAAKDEAPSGGAAATREQLLREHFEQLTASFLQPLYARRPAPVSSRLSSCHPHGLTRNGHRRPLFSCS